MIRAAYFVYKPNSQTNQILSQLGYAARKLWNVGNYEKRNWTNESNTPFPDWYVQKKQLKSHFWYKNLPSQTAQEVLKVLQEAWKSYFELKKSKGIENPHPPRYKHQNANIKYLNNGFRIEGKKIRFSIPCQLRKYLKEKHQIENKFFYLSIPDHIQAGKVKTVEFKRLAEGEYKVILSQESDDCHTVKDSPYFMAIDLGIANALTCYSFTGESSIVSGKQWLSVERYFHKKIAHYQAISDAQACAKGIQYPKKSKKVNQLYRKKKGQTFHILHCMTKKVVDLAVQQKVKTIVIGDITNIRKGKNLGKATNQKLHALPFRKMVQMITYKAEAEGIGVREITEEYTSQTCSICKPEPSKENSNKTNRIFRGLYHCRECGAKINADVNGAINISKKYLKELNAQSVVVLGTPKMYTFNGQQFVA